MGKKKKFIDKKKSATFQLLPRDLSGPNYDVGPAGDRVFVRVDTNPYELDPFSDPDSIFADAPEDGSVAAPLADDVRREILELGFPDDGYNYLIHLREIKNTGGGSTFYRNTKATLNQIPLDVKAYDASRAHITKVDDDPNDKLIYSVAAETVGAIVQKAVDPEVAALLDDSDLSRFGSDVEDLEEDFVVQANLPEEGEDAVHKKSEVTKEENSLPHNNVVQSSGAGRVRDFLPEAGDECAHEKPRVRRPLDEQFDLLELNEYGTDSDGDFAGSLAEEDELLPQKLNVALKEHVKNDLELDNEYKVPADVLNDNEGPKNTELLDSAADVIQRCLEYAETYENENENEDESMVVLQQSSDESEEWDCETIISTYSNLDNHPGTIEAPGTNRKKKLSETVSEVLSASGPVIALRGKEGLPMDFLPGTRKAAMEKVKVDGSLKMELLKRRQRGQESKEEKKERKAAVKEERCEARRMKKEMKGLYRCEAKHAQKVAAISGPSSIHLM